MKNYWVIAILMGIAGFALATPARADAFKSAKDCVAGKRVIDRQNRKGTVVKLANDNLCQVKLDEDGKTEYFIFWMLTELGQNPNPPVKLVVGTYECFQGGQYTFMDMYVTGENTYKSDAGSGRFRVEANNKIVFETGPLAKYTSRAEAGPHILLSTNGGSFYGTSCELKK